MMANPFYGKLILLTLLTLTPLPALGQEHAADTPITQALLPLPDPLRHGATVVLDSREADRAAHGHESAYLPCRYRPRQDSRFTATTQTWMPSSPESSS